VIKTADINEAAHFFPSQAIIPLGMVFDKRTRTVLGVQGLGPMGDAVLARLDAAAALIAKGATVEDFINLEMAYAPPFAAAVAGPGAAVARDAGRGVRGPDRGAAARPRVYPGGARSLTIAATSASGLKGFVTISTAS
jgi:hypothetical protein